MTITTADLPPAVARAVNNLDPTHPAAGIAHLRYLAACSYRAIGTIWDTGQHHQMIEQAALFIGYQTAALRLEEEAAT